MKKVLIILCLLLSQQSFANDGHSVFNTNIEGKSYTTSITRYGNHYQVNTCQSFDLSTVQALADMYREYKAKKQAEKLERENANGEQ
jgi:hypothetical protein